ncbi:hypothetical protein [Vibrio halioticoli]|uniref:hypothetical protein n=1 Tax=Vibrio halioticoli TaxID=71388 RepID=UPI0012EC2600|nr:hypothetical protein [Vibrio halioticoli]
MTAITLAGCALPRNSYTWTRYDDEAATKGYRKNVEGTKGLGYEFIKASVHLDGDQILYENEVKPLTSDKEVSEGAAKDFAYAVCNTAKHRKIHSIIIATRNASSYGVRIAMDYYDKPGQIVQKVTCWHQDEVY